MASKFLLIPSSISLVVPLSLINIGSSSNNEIVLATYQSYIKDEIATQAYDKFALKTIYFENDKEVFGGFASGAFDLAIVSSSTLEEAVEKKLVKKIDWSRFTNTISSKINGTPTSNNQAVTSSAEKQYDFTKLYSPTVNQFFSISSNIRDYGIPYFLSFFMFAYRGKELKLDSPRNSGGSNSNSENNNGIKDWAQLIEVVSKDPRFQPSEGLPKLGLIEDELTIFSFSKLSSKDKSQGDVNEVKKLFNNEKTIQTEEEIYQQFRNLSEAGLNSKMGPNSLLLSPDSAVLSEMLQKKDLMGVFTYNGDALATLDLMDEEQEWDDESEEEEESQTEASDEETNWPRENYEEMRYTPVLQSLQNEIKTKLKEEEGSQGAEELSEKEEGDQLNFWVGSPYLWFLDSIAISAKVSPEKEEKIYEFLEKLSFAGMEKKNDSSSGEQSPQSKVSAENKTMPKNRRKKLELELLFGRESFESCLKKDSVEALKITSSSPKPTTTNTSISSNSNQNSDGKQCPIVFERGFKDQQNLNLALAFQKWKNNY